MIKTEPNDPTNLMCMETKYCCYCNGSLFIGTSTYVIILLPFEYTVNALNDISNFSFS